MPIPLSIFLQSCGRVPPQSHCLILSYCHQLSSVLKEGKRGEWQEMGTRVGHEGFRVASCILLLSKNVIHLESTANSCKHISLCHNFNARYFSELRSCQFSGEGGDG
jgi:hypothetical protein